MKRGNFDGLSDAQVRLILEQIATLALALSDEATRLAAGPHAGSGDLETTLHHFALMASTIGTLADTPLDGEVGGRPADWLIGPAFEAARERADAVPPPAPAPTAPARRQRGRKAVAA